MHLAAAHEAGGEAACDGTARSAGWCGWKHWWTCEPVAVAPAPARPIPLPPTPPRTRTGTGSEPPRGEIEPRSTTASSPGRESKPGEVTIELNNQGEDPHNLNLQREGDEGEPLQIAETDSGSAASPSFDLPAGKYRLWCSLPEHEEKGMHDDLDVE